MTKIEFINKMNQAIDEAFEKGSRFNKAVALAQAALESNWGNSELAQKANNLFSIKAWDAWTGETVRLPGKEWNYEAGWYQELITWRKYPSWTDCILDYAGLIASLTWYQDALAVLDDPKLFLKALLPNALQPGWATDPQYYDKILKIAAEMEAYGGPKWS